jgi:hypothetical protein
VIVPCRAAHSNRAGGQLLTDAEWEQYAAAVEGKRCLSSAGTRAATSTAVAGLGAALAVNSGTPEGGGGARKPRTALAASAPPQPLQQQQQSQSHGSSTAGRVARITACMEVAAAVMGDEEEASFWRHLPHTLQVRRDVFWCVWVRVGRGRAAGEAHTAFQVNGTLLLWLVALPVNPGVHWRPEPKAVLFLWLPPSRS